MRDFEGVENKMFRARNVTVKTMYKKCCAGGYFTSRRSHIGCSFCPLSQKLCWQAAYFPPQDTV